MDTFDIKEKYMEMMSNLILYVFQKLQKGRFCAP